MLRRILTSFQVSMRRLGFQETQVTLKLALFVPYRHVGLPDNDATHSLVGKEAKILSYSNEAFGGLR